MAAVCIIFCHDGMSWFNYFDNYLRRVFPDITIEPFEESSLLQMGNYSFKAKTALKQSKVNIFIVSPGYLHFYIENPTVTFKDLSNNAKVVVFLCGTGLDDFVMEDVNGVKIADRLPVFEKQYLLSYPQHDEMLEKVVVLLEPEHAIDKDIKESTVIRKEDKPAHKSNGKRKRRSKGFKFIPREVDCEGSSDVVISFDNMDAGEESEIKVEVEIEGDGDGEGSTKVTAAYLNPYTCSFRAPERRAGVVKVCVYLQGKALGTEELTYSSPAMDAISGIHQIYIRQINELCSHLNDDQLLELDSCLSTLLHDESKGLIPAGAFEYFHRVYRFQSSDVSEFELPTVFHLAAKYGLKELCQQFADLPDARYSFCTYNVYQKLPEDVARSTNHSEIANWLENLRESDIFQKLYDSYMIMNKGEMSPSYLLQSSRIVEGDCDDDYEDVPTEDHISAMAVQRFKPESGKTSNFGSRGEILSSQIDDEKERASSCSFVKKYLEPMENPYECRMQKPKMFPSVKFIEGMPTIPKSQQELIHIMEQVKNKLITMADAEVLFKEWKMRHQKKTASIKQKEDQLAKIREETEKAQKEKKDTFHFSQFLGKKTVGVLTNQTIPPGRKDQPAKSSAEEMGDRISTASSSSRESSCSIRSRTSTTSGIDIEETIQEEVALKPHPKPKNSNRKSVHLQRLAIELNSPGALVPPPLPPRVMVKTVAPPSIPLPRLERAPSPKSSSRGTDPAVNPCLSPIVEPSGAADKLRLQTQNVKRTGADPVTPKKFLHQELMPELDEPSPVDEPRKLSLPIITSSSSPCFQKNVVSIVREEDEPETKRTPPRTPKPRRKTDGADEELKKVLQQKAEGVPSGIKSTVKTSPVVSQDKESSSSDTSSNPFMVSLKPVKNRPVVPTKSIKK